MSEQEILKNNELIAIFMGHIDGQHEEWCGNNILEENGFTGETEMMSYEPHKDWNRLMPAWEKIGELEDINAKLNNTEATIILHDKRKIQFYSIDLKVSIYRCVIEFVNWYNTNKNP